MVKSMTGYGRAHGIVDGRNITVEIKSVNHRYFDCSFKVPRLYGFLEEPMRSYMQQWISRGKIDVYVAIEQFSSDDVSVEVNAPLAKAYVTALKNLVSDYGLSDDITACAVARMPDVLTTVKADPDVDAIIAAVRNIADVAAEEYNEMRASEGVALARDVSQRAAVIGELVKKIEEYSPKSVAAYAERLEQRMTEILDGREVDEGRLITEVAIFADRISVTEEIVRLNSHLSQLESMFESNDSVGRKIDFLIQELNREVNTIGSKSSDIEATRIVVDMKAEIEKIREQIQNIE